MPANPPRLCVVIETDLADRVTLAESVARALSAPFLNAFPDSDPYELALVATDERLELRVLAGEPTLAGGHPIVSDLTAIDTTSGPGRSLGQPLIKAVGIKRREAYRPSVFDVTAGLGEDAWVLASVGCTVRAYERNPVTHALLSDGLARAQLSDSQTAGRLATAFGSGVEALNAFEGCDADERPDIVYLDPMFPLGRKTAERKAMRVLRLLSGDDTDADALLAAALPVATRRVVVKRPLRAEPIKGPEPTVVHKGKSLRFDVYVTC